MKIDPQRQVERLAESHASLSRRSRPYRLELYHRESRTRRLSRESDFISRQEGVDDGVAVRVQERPEAPVAFSACTGGDEHALLESLDAASRSAASTSLSAPSDPDWSPSRSGDLRDWSHDDELPDFADLESWFADACRDLVKSRWFGQRSALDLAWVEAASTVESWVTGAGLRASRTRTRLWALARVAVQGRSCRPLVLAARGRSRLPASGWNDVALARHGDLGVRDGDASSVIFPAEVAATLVSALLRSAHVSERLVGTKVGPGWSVTDDPRSSDSLAGGAFDDAAFDTEERQLADGRKIVRALSGPGTFRRASYRDIPTSAPSRVVVAPPDLGTCTGVVAADLAIHPLPDGTWVLVVDDADPERAWHASTTPLELLERCVGGLGPPLSSHRGVVTPALVFRDLRLHPSS